MYAYITYDIGVNVALIFRAAPAEKLRMTVVGCVSSIGGY